MQINQALQYYKLKAMHVSIKLCGYPLKHSSSGFYPLLAPGTKTRTLAGVVDPKEASPRRNQVLCHEISCTDKRFVVNIKQIYGKQDIFQLQMPKRECFKALFSSGTAEGFQIHCYFTIWCMQSILKQTLVKQIVKNQFTSLAHPH